MKTIFFQWGMSLYLTTIHNNCFTYLILEDKAIGVSELNNTKYTPNLSIP